MFDRLLKIRYLIVVVVVLAVMHALAFLVMAAQIGARAYWHVLHETRDAPGDRDARPGLELLHSMDFLFVALVFIVLALGIARLFLLDPKATRTIELPSWLQIDSITALKVLLWETILTTLLIASLSELSGALFAKLEWSALVTPVAILILALSLYLMKKH
jgi:uncharacterized membrane protein YqhA